MARFNYPIVTIISFINRGKFPGWLERSLPTIGEMEEGMGFESGPISTTISCNKLPKSN